MGIFDFLKGKPVKKAETIKVSKKPVKKTEPIKAPAKKRDLKEVYKIIKEPHVSEKATQLSDERKYAFKVYSFANKSEIKKSISNLYGVKVKEVKIINIKSKKRSLRGIEGRKKGYKKAIVVLEQGYKIEIMPH